MTRFETAFLVNPELDLEQLQDAIAQRMGGARAMAAMLQGADVANLNQIATLQYLCALEGVLEELERLHDRLWQVIDAQTHDNATPETACLLN